MKKLNLLFFIIFLFSVTGIKAAETEPNNSKANANTLSLNGSNTGAINVAGDEDWYKVTTNADGKLDVIIAVSNGITLRCYIYDNDGTTELSSGYSSATTTVSKDGLEAGVYYIKLIAYSNGQLPAYTVSNTLTKPTQANDAEPNNSPAQAKVLGLNDSQTGHVSYYYNSQRDTADWYKITTNADGLLRLTLTPANGATLYVYLYDNDGTTFLDNAYSSANAVVNVDGLAAGTYYVKVRGYSPNNFAPYTLADSLFKPAQANDTEPNDSRNQAKVLPLNSDKTGHVSYYYNSQRDTADWYKITTNADGLLRLTLTPANGATLYAYLYDNNGTTVLDNAYSSTNAVVNVDGLAAGTYYVKVRGYSPNYFAPYTLADSLFKPAQANDTEPNDSRDEAIVLPLNSDKTGHVSYYYNSQRDTADWYKITTNADGLLRLTLTPANDATLYVYLYDNDGTTLLDNAYSSAKAVVNVDGLAAGTYYVKVRGYSPNYFAPYTLADSLFSYSYSKDEEPNSKPYMAKTILSNEFTDGHVGFYYNNTRDTADWWKINYTGSGNLSFTINQETLKSGGTNTLYFQVYKDTTKSPIHSSYSSAASRQIALTALSKGYYWIKINGYSNSNFSSYSFSNSFIQINTAKVTVSDYDSPGSCSSTNDITFNCINGQSPYALQLYRFGVPYGEPVTTNRKAVFKNLPEGLYYAHGYSDGATGTAFAKSKTIKLIPTPAGLNTTNILAVRATINWTTVPCAAFYSISYSEHNSGVWTTKSTDGNVNNYVLKGLSPNTMYDWTVASVDTANNKKMIGQYADSISFTTAASLIADNNNAADNVSINSGKGFGSVITIAPNPAISYFIIHYNASAKSNLTAGLYDVNGKPVWTSGSINADALNGKKVMVNQFGSGLYYLKIVDAQGAVLGTAKVSITK